MHPGQGRVTCDSTSVKSKDATRVSREYDEYLYRERHLVECFINKIKHYRHIFSRFDKLSSPFLGFLNFVGALIWLR